MSPLTFVLNTLLRFQMNYILFYNMYQTCIQSCHVLLMSWPSKCVFFIPDITLQWLIHHSKSRRSWKCRSCVPTVFAMLLSCHIVITLQSYTAVSSTHMLLYFACVTSFFPFCPKCWQCTTKHLILVPNLMNVGGIIRPEALTWSKNLIFDLPFIFQTLPGWSYLLVYNTSLGFTTVEALFTQTGLTYFDNCHPCPLF